MQQHSHECLSEAPQESSVDPNLQPLSRMVPVVLANLAPLCRSMIAYSVIPIAITGEPDHMLECISPGFARLFKLIDF